MKKFIKQKLVEMTNKYNSLNVLVTKPTQELIVMRGISGSGKSTKAKSLVGKGIIHSTDDVISSIGDYNEFFAKMIANKDFSPLSKVHAQNLNDAIKSMTNGITPVIIDNTNIKVNEPKAYVMAALKLGFDDNNIKFVDIGAAGLDAKDLAKRNTHGVPLEKIQAMIDSHTAQGPLTLKKVLDSKDMYSSSDILYSAVVLDETSKSMLLNRFKSEIPKGWKLIAHHMTIEFGKGVENKEDLGKLVTLTITELGISDMAMAVKVDGYPSKKEIPHITLAVNPNGGKPAMSDKITDWTPVPNITVCGIVTNITK